MEILALFFGVFTSFLLFYYRKAFNRSNLYLALFYLCSNLIVFVYVGLHLSKSPFWEGICFVNFMPLSFVIGPLLFYYVKYAVAENKNIKPIDWLHLVPALLVMLDSLPYTTLPFSKKIEIAHHIQSVTQDYDFKVSCFSLKQMMFIRPLHLILYCVFSLIYFRQATKRRKTTFGLLPSSHAVIKNWIYSIIMLQLFIASYCLLDTYTTFITKNDLGIFTYQNYFRVLGSLFFIQNSILFLFPKILFNTISYPDATLAKTSMPKLKKLNTLEINENIIKLLDQYMIGAPFLLNDFSLSKMALDLKISERVLSNYFNTELSITFSKWKNDQRIDYACSIIKNGKVDKITIEGIALNVGFLSRSKFIDAFKDRKGILPSAYIKQFGHNK